MGKNFYQLCCGRRGSWHKSLVGPYSQHLSHNGFLPAKGIPDSPSCTQNLTFPSVLLAGRTALLQPEGKSPSERRHGLLPTLLLLDFNRFSAELVYNLQELSFRIFGLFSVFLLMHENTGTLPTHFHPS